MSELYALGPCSGARGVVDGHRGVLVGDLQPRRRAGPEEEPLIGGGAEDETVLDRDLAQGLVELGVDEEHGRAGVLDDVADLLGIETEVHGHQDPPEHADPEQADQEAGGVGRDDGDAVVLRDAQVVEGGGQAARPLREGRVREAAEAAAGGARLVDHRLAIAIDELRTLEKITESQRNDHFRVPPWMNGRAPRAPPGRTVRG